VFSLEYVIKVNNLKINYLCDIKYKIDMAIGYMINNLMFSKNNFEMFCVPTFGQKASTIKVKI